MATSHKTRGVHVTNGAPTVRTDLDRAVDRVLQVFGALSGFALVKFATTTMDKEPTGPWVVWPLAIALAAFLLRFIVGSAIHLNQRFVNDVPTPDKITPGVIALFIKDLFFVVAFGLIAVGLTECQSIETFIFWSMIFVSLGLAWGVIDFVVRGCGGDNWGKLEIPWLVMDLLQTGIFFLLYIWSIPHPHKAVIFAGVCVLFLIADIICMLTP
jgi:hypothetical protein